MRLSSKVRLLDKHSYSGSFGCFSIGQSDFLYKSFSMDVGELVDIIERCILRLSFTEKIIIKNDSLVVVHQLTTQSDNIFYLRTFASDFFEKNRSISFSNAKKENNISTHLLIMIVLDSNVFLKLSGYIFHDIANVIFVNLNKI